MKEKLIPFGKWEGAVQGQFPKVTFDLDLERQVDLMQRGRKGHSRLRGQPEEWQKGREVQDILEKGDFFH